MTDFQFALLAQLVAKVIVALSGLGSVYMGYRLFSAGVFRGGAAIQAKDLISMTKGGPGLLFALFGAGVIIAAIAMDMDVHISDREQSVTVPK